MQAGGIGASPRADRRVDGFQSIVDRFDPAAGREDGLFQALRSSWEGRDVIGLEQGCAGLFGLRRLLLFEQACVGLVANALDRLIQADDVSSPGQRVRRIGGGLCREASSRTSASRPIVRLGPSRLWPAAPGPADATAAVEPSDDCSLSVCNSSVSVKRVPTRASDVSFRERSWAEPPGLADRSGADAAALSSS